MLTGALLGVLEKRRKMKADKNMVVDGVFYRQGDDIWDLGSFETTNVIGMIRNYQGFSEDVSKLPHYVHPGSTAFLIDTGERMIFHGKTNKWYKVGTAI